MFVQCSQDAIFCQFCFQVIRISFTSKSLPGVATIMCGFFPSAVASEHKHELSSVGFIHLWLAASSPCHPQSLLIEHLSSFLELRKLGLFDMRVLLLVLAQAQSCGVTSISTSRYCAWYLHTETVAFPSMLEACYC